MSNRNIACILNTLFQHIIFNPNRLLRQKQEKIFFLTHKPLKFQVYFWTSRYRSIYKVIDFFNSKLNN